LGHSKAQLPIILRGIILRDFTIQISRGKVNLTSLKGENHLAVHAKALHHQEEKFIAKMTRFPSPFLIVSNLKSSQGEV
jgi:hypothetical protein